MRVFGKLILCIYAIQAADIGYYYAAVYLFSYRRKEIYILSFRLIYALAVYGTMHIKAKATIIIFLIMLRCLC